MSRSTIGTRYWRRWFAPASVVLLVVPYATGCIQYFAGQGTLPIRPALLLAITAMLVGLNVFGSRPRLPRSVLLLLVLLGLRVASAIVEENIEERTILEESITTTYGASFLFALALLGMTGDQLTVRRSSVFCSLVTIAVVAGLNSWEWQYPGYFSNVPGRSAGWLENANGAALVLSVMTAVFLSLRLPVSICVAIAGLSALGTYFTLSRAGFLIWPIIFVAYLFLVVRTKPIKLVVMCISSAIVVLLLFMFADLTPAFGDEDLFYRQRLLTGETQIDFTGDSRAIAAIESWHGILKKPILGYGSGVTLGYPFTPHNQLLGVWLENGLLGMLLFATALFSLLRECWIGDKGLLVCCVPLIAFIPFNHNLLEDKSYVFAWVMAAAMASRHERLGPQTRTKAVVNPMKVLGKYRRPGVR